MSLRLETPQCCAYTGRYSCSICEMMMWVGGQPMTHVFVVHHHRAFMRHSAVLEKSVVNPSRTCMICLAGGLRLNTVTPRYGTASITNYLLRNGHTVRWSVGELWVAPDRGSGAGSTLTR